MTQHHNPTPQGAEASALIELAERCEKAEGPDSQLNRAIVVALQPEAMFEEEPGYEDEPIVYHAEPLVRWKHLLPNYTASLDAALTLVPEGFAWSVQYSDATNGEAWLYPPDNTADVQFYATAATPALALVAASLRAAAKETTP